MFVNAYVLANYWAIIHPYMFILHADHPFCMQYPRWLCGVLHQLLYLKMLT